MKVRSPIAFRRKDGTVAMPGDAVDASEIKDFKFASKPEPYSTKVVRETPDDPEPKPAKKSSKKAKKKDD